MSRREVEWPADEPIPNTLEEALAMGWQAVGLDTTSRYEDSFQTGYVELSKKIKVAGMEFEFLLDVPYTARFTFDRPGQPAVWEDTDPIRERQ